MTSPFLKWAGGKRWQLEDLLPLIRERLSPSSVYFEPCVGGGAVLHALDHPNRYASDVNPYLIRTYQAVQEEVWKVAQALQGLVEQYNDGPQREVYEDVRAEWNERKDDNYLPRALQAAVFIFLNRTGYNGLYRENQSGRFNVPWGKKPQLVWKKAADALASAHESLARVTIRHHGFDEIARLAAPGDVVYFDPPYLTEENGFTAYTGAGFALEQHQALGALALELRECGVHVLVSGSDTETTRRAYRGFKKFTSVAARRSVGARNREKASELIMIA